MLFAPLVFSCSKKDYIRNPDRISDFHAIISNTGRPLPVDNVDLFVDYSTCIAEAVKNSSFFAKFRTNLSGCNPVLWSIKGNEIARVTANQDSINFLMNDITEVPYSDLIGAVHRIATGNHQALLLTDGEYLTKPEGERTDLPYLLNDFKLWLSKGFEIVIYVEPYKERNKFEKRRFYFLFTDARAQNNFAARIANLVDLSSFPEIKMFKLVNPEIKVGTNYASLKQPRANPVLSVNEMSYKKGYNYEFQEYQIGWPDISQYIRYAADSATGKEIPGGDFLFRGIFVNTKGLEYFSVGDVDIRVSDVYNEFRQFEDSVQTRDKHPAAESFRELPEILKMDKECFAKTGEVTVKIHPNFNGDMLNKKGQDPEKENLFKVDVVVNRASDLFDQRSAGFDCFKWQSMWDPKKVNISVYESIKQLIKDPAVNPVNVNRGVIYTVYIKTPPFDN
ncbi:MAG: hypothetical protein WCK34_00750 [Bacteroidota bacterium]